MFGGQIKFYKSTLKLFNQNYPLTTQANMLFHSGKYFTFLNLSHMGKEKYCSHQPPEAFIHKVIRGKNFTYVAFVSTRSSFVQLYERGIVEPKIRKSPSTNTAIQKK